MYGSWFSIFLEDINSWLGTTLSKSIPVIFLDNFNICLVEPSSILTSQFLGLFSSNCMCLSHSFLWSCQRPYNYEYLQPFHKSSFPFLQLTPSNLDPNTSLTPLESVIHWFYHLFAIPHGSLLPSLNSIVHHSNYLWPTPLIPLHL